MSMVHLYIDNPDGDPALVDLYDNESIALNWRFTEISDFGVRGSFTREFRVPGTDRNEDVFRAWFNVNAAAGTFDHMMKTPATLNVETLPMSTGHIQLRKVYLRGEHVHEYEIVFYAETPDLITAVGEKKLADLTDLPTLNHEVIYDNVTTGSPGEWDYALTDRGQKWSEGGEQGTRPVFNSNQPLYAADLTPIVSARYIFDQIMADAGFVWDGWDGSTALADALDGYWHPWLNSQFIQYTEPPEAVFFKIGYSANQTGLSLGGTWVNYIPPAFTEVYDNGNNVASNIFTAPFTGLFEFRMRIAIDIQLGGGNGPIKMQLWDPDSSQAVVSSQVYSIGDAATFLTYNTPPVLLEQGQRVQMSLTGAIPQFTLQGDAGYTKTYFELLSCSGALAGGTIDMPLNAPDFKQIDYIRDIVKMHNCAVIPDRNIPNKIYFEPMETFIGTGATRDWTGKLDTSKDVMLSPTTDLQRRILKWTYTAGNDAASRLYVDTAQRIYGDYLIEGYTGANGQAPNDFAQGDTTIELKMQSTPAAYINGTGIVIPKFVNSEGNFQNPGLRILYLSDTSAPLAFYDDDLETTPPVPVVTTLAVNLINHYSDGVNTSVTDFDLNWAPEQALHEVAAQPFNNLFNQWYRDYVNGIYDRTARMMEAHFYLTLSDVVTFSFADRIWIKDAYWRILEISDYAVGDDRPTRVVLLKLIDVAPDCLYFPSSVTNGGIVKFSDYDGNTNLDGSETCCTRYGYTWDADSTTCWAFRSRKPINYDYANSLSGWGVNGESGGGPNDTPPPSSALGSGMTLAPDATFSYFGGTFINSGRGNRSMIAVGDDITFSDDLRGAAAFNRNLLVQYPGIHSGGGYDGDDRDASTSGRAQFGFIPFQVSGDFTTGATELELLIEGRAANRLNLDTDCSWSCILTVIGHKVVGGTIAEVASSAFAFGIYKNAVASATSVDALSQQGTNKLSLTIDTTTDTDEHRLKMTLSGGGGHPHDDYKISAVLQYSQVI